MFFSCSKCTQHVANSECAACDQHSVQHVLMLNVFVFSSATFVSCLALSTHRRTKMAQELEVLNVIGAYGVAGRPLEKSDARQVQRLAEAGKALLDECAKDLIAASHGRPVLYQYQGDGTPLKLKSAFQVAFAEHQKTARSGYSGVELFCQGAFVRSLDSVGNPLVACIMKEPRPMAGKTGLHAINGLREFFPTLDEIGHRGFNIHHYSWDRAIFSACRSYARRMHTVILRNICDRTSQQEGTLRVLQSWLLCTGCGLHDVHNGLTWGLSKLLQSKDMLDDLYIVLESLRNGFKHLQVHLPAWLADVVVFDDISFDRDSLHAFWTALDVTPELCNMLADRGILWLEGKLRVGTAHRDDPEIMLWLYNSMMTVFRFKKYSAGRWISVGCSLRTLVASCALGLRELHQATIDAGASTYYLGGFRKLTGNMRLFSVITAIASRPTEALSLMMLEDDRAVRLIEEYEGCLSEEMQWMAHISDPVWEMLALVACNSGSTGRAIRSACLDCAHTSCSYTHRNFLSHVRSLPWSLAIGDIDANLESLATSSVAHDDPVVKKIQTLLKMKFSRPQLIEAVGMFRDCRWSTAFAEQLHAHAAVLHRLHREYTAETLCSRTMLSFMKLLVGSDPVEQQEQKAKRKLTLLGRKKPEKAGGRANFVGAFVHETKELTASNRTMTVAETQAAWSAGGERWSELTHAQKRSFDASSSASSHAKRVCIEADKAKVVADLALVKERHAQELRKAGLLSRASSCRLSEAQRARLQVLYDSFSNVETMRRIAMQELDVPPRHLVEAMASVNIPPSAVVATQPEDWCKQMCKHREHLAQTLLCASSLSHKRFFYFCYATQSPQEIVLAPLEAMGDLKPASSGSACGAKDVPALVHCASFSLTLGHYISGRALKLKDEEWMYVIPNAGFHKDSGLVQANSDDAVFYQDFLKGLPEPAAEPQAASAGARNSAQQELLKAHPWLQQALSKKHSKKPESEDEDEDSDEEDKKMSDDIVEKVMQRLHAHRQELAGLHDGPGQDFEVYMRREYALRGAAGVGGADSATGEARTTAQDFCRQHSMRMSSTYSFSLCGGQQAATRLAQEWCRKMQHFYTAFVEQGHARLDWNAVSLAFPSDPEFEEFVRSAPNDAVRQRAAALATLIPL